MSNNAITTTTGTQRNALSALTAQLGLSDQGEVYNIMKATVMPSGASDEELAAFCMVASAYKLNPLIKEIHAFRSKSGGIQPMVGIDGWLKLLHEREDFDGMEHRYAEDNSWVECAIYSKKVTRPTVVREYMAENRMGSSPVWQQRPLRMLRHRATIQAIRYFCGLGGLADKDEFMEFEQAQEQTMRNVTAKPAAKEQPKRLVAKPAAKSAAKEQPGVAAEAPADYAETVRSSEVAEEKPARLHPELDGFEPTWPEWTPEEN